jgi:hypothetical protein
VICYAGENGKTIVFTETKADANSIILTDNLVRKDLEVMHGDIA